MGHLAFLGSRKVNGVSALHGELMKQTVFRPLHRLFPDRITAITNGVTPRRWLLDCQPGPGEPDQRHAGRPALDHRPGAAARTWRRRPTDAGVPGRASPRSSRRNKERLATFVAHGGTDIVLPADALFDVQIKRIHEYKRQLLNILEAVATYADIAGRHGQSTASPRVKIFAGKAAPSYMRAKLIIKFINDVAKVVNADAAGQRPAEDRVPARTTTSRWPQILIPGADLSEQISTAGMEASGTGNMKFGAQRRARPSARSTAPTSRCCEHVGPENIFIFGLTADEVARQPRGGLLAARPRSRPARAWPGRSS